MMQSGSANTRVAVRHGSFPSLERRPIDYDRLVSEFLVESRARITDSPAPRAVVFEQHSSFDMVHRISIAAGYIGLAAGFALVGAAFIWQIP